MRCCRGLLQRKAEHQTVILTTIGPALVRALRQCVPAEDRSDCSGPDFQSSADRAPRRQARSHSGSPENRRVMKSTNSFTFKARRWVVG